MMESEKEGYNVLFSSSDELSSDGEFSGFDPVDAISLQSSPAPSSSYVRSQVVLPEKVNLSVAKKSSDATKRKYSAPKSSDHTNKKSYDSAKKSSVKSSDKSGKKSSDSSNKRNNDNQKKKQIPSTQKEKSSDIFDISKLTATDIESLRGILGIPHAEPNTQYDEFVFDEEYDEPMEWSNVQPMTVQIDAKDISDSEEIPQVDFAGVLGNDVNNNEEWTLPKLKVPDMGNPVHDNLAKLVNMACSKQCELNHVISKYKVPANCEMAVPPTVNQEIWRVMHKSGHLNDKLMTDIQNLVAAGVSSVLKLTECLKDTGMSSEVKSVISDILTILGQTQYNLSIRRRYMIRPALKRKYAGLCNMSTAITQKLFGDHIEKEIKNCDTQVFLGKDSYPQRGYPYRGRTGNRYPSRRGGYYPRYQPYDARQRLERGASGSYGAYRGRPRPFRRGASATATAPNDQD